jgi:hypothetical protein
MNNRNVDDNLNAVFFHVFIIIVVALSFVGILPLFSRCYPVYVFAASIPLFPFFAQRCVIMSGINPPSSSLGMGWGGGQLIRQLPFPCLDGEAPTRSIFFSFTFIVLPGIVLPGITLMVTEVK